MAINYACALDAKALECKALSNCRQGIQQNPGRRVRLYAFHGQNLPPAACPRTPLKQPQHMPHHLIDPPSLGQMGINVWHHRLSRNQKGQWAALHQTNDCPPQPAKQANDKQRAPASPHQHAHSGLWRHPASECRH